MQSGRAVVRHPRAKSSVRCGSKKRSILRLAHCVKLGKLKFKILSGMITSTRHTNGSRQQSLSCATKRHSKGANLHSSRAHLSRANQNRKVGSMDILEKFKDYLKQNELKAPSFHPYFEEALNYMLQAGGKHFRAQLLLGVVSAVDERRFEGALAIAMALEMIHTYSLIHDDLPAMDDADLRRGRPSLHKKYDEVTAILVGDALNTDAFLIAASASLSDEIKIKCIKTLARNAGSSGMVLGQAIDCRFENSPLKQSELEFLHLHKTGALIAAAFELGAIIGGLNDELAHELYKIGLKLGLMFQIEDDIIDATGDEASAGKPVGADGAKNSFVNLLGLAGARSYKQRLIDEVGGAMSGYDASLRDLVLNLIEKYLKG